MRINVLAAALIGGMCAVSAAEELDTEEKKSFSFQPGGLVSLTADEGFVTVSSWDREEVEVLMIKRAWGRSRREAEEALQSLKVDFSVRGDRLIIREVTRYRERNFNIFDIFDGDFWDEQGWRRASIDFELKVPEETNLKIECDEGEMDIRSIRGDVELEADEGDIAIDSVIGEQIRISSDEGRVRITGVSGSDRSFMSIECDEGDVYIYDCDVAEIDCSSDEGRVVLDGTRVTRFWLSSDEGDLTADFLPRTGGKYRLETDEGDIEIALPDQSDISVQLRTEDGYIRNDFNWRSIDLDDGERLEGTLGSGDALLRAYTDEGDIDISRK